MRRIKSSHTSARCALNSATGSFFGFRLYTGRASSYPNSAAPTSVVYG